MVQTLKVLSALLTYPEVALKDAAPELRTVIVDEGLLPAHVAEKVLELIEQIETRDLFDLQERYVLLFDRTRTLSLHLFEHIHGEGRDRGQAMVDLMALYQKHGLEISAKELPDYLPMFLEFLSTLSLDEARETLSQPLHIISALGERLRKRESIYGGVFRGLVEISTGQPNEENLKALLEMPDDDPNDLEALDEIWEAEAVAFGPEPDQADGCPMVSDMLKQMQTDPASPDNPAGDASPGSN
ncbi:MAG: nitrate reductase molybdenum cofactor assembly chaperone [Rhodospirillaceae bacterium]|jgi:nitrate reductase molybdenum cofactor assembly chaperone NarJ/NarW|nr:nitrate reductase molybdenum cofactor assembly chaperone [Rhodospirillaceae bacterium]